MAIKGQEKKVKHTGHNITRPVYQGLASQFSYITGNYFKSR